MTEVKRVKRIQKIEEENEKIIAGEIYSAKLNGYNQLLICSGNSCLRISETGGTNHSDTSYYQDSCTSIKRVTGNIEIIIHED